MNHTRSPLVRSAAIALTLTLAAFITWSVTSEDNASSARPSATARQPGATVR